MLEKLAILAPLALILPFVGEDENLPVPDQDRHFGEERVPDGAAKSLSSSAHILPARYAVPSNFQVRIEQRVIVRISPRSANSRQNLVAEIQPLPERPRFKERKIGKCLPVRNIAAVQTGSGNRLLLFTRDQRIISAKLEKACRARDFYSGFYIEQNKDGNLCVDRDKLQSRAGANCELSRIRQLVQVGG